MMTDRSDAAKRAWETRRANARKIDYQNRARKAWATRKSREASSNAAADEASAKRRAAALKAWETRRKAQ